MRFPRLSTLILALAGLGACSYSGYPTGTDYPPVARTVQVSYCSGLAPQWVAFQDGDGAWTRVLPTATGSTRTFQFDFLSDRGGIATLVPAGSGRTSLSVLYGAPEELPTAGNTRAALCLNSPSKTLLGTVAGLDADEIAVIGGGLQARTQVAGAEGNAFALKSLQSGPQDLIAGRTTPVDGRSAVTSFILRRDVDLPDSTMLPVFDFTSAEAFAPAPATLTINGFGAEGASVGLRLITGNADILLPPAPAPSAEVTRSYMALPLARLRPGDVQLLSASAFIGTAERVSQVYFRDPSDRTLTLPAPVLLPEFGTVATAPTLRLRARFIPQADYDRSTSIVYQREDGSNVVVTMTAAYAAMAANGYDLIVPDLSGAAGFDPGWGLHPSVLQWTAIRNGGTLPLGAGAQPTEGATRRAGYASDIIPGG